MTITNEMLMAMSPAELRDLGNRVAEIHNLKRSMSARENASKFSPYDWVKFIGGTDRRILPTDVFVIEKVNQTTASCKCERTGQRWKLHLDVIEKINP